jgi:hypothetical protein
MVTQNIDATPSNTELLDIDELLLQGSNQARQFRAYALWSAAKRERQQGNRELADRLKAAGNGLVHKNFQANNPPEQKLAALTAKADSARESLARMPFGNRGFSDRTINALVAGGIDAPERLLFTPEVELKRISASARPPLARSGAIALDFFRPPHRCSMIRRWLLLIMVWFRRVFLVTTPVTEPEAPLPSLSPVPAPVEEPLLPPPSELPPAPLPVESTIIVRPAKWVKPKGEKPTACPRPKPDSKPKVESKPKAPRPQLKGEDPEQWGQYYFRDAILDQLDTYFTYLRRMKVNARHAYDLHSRLGIHVLPQSAVQSFDNWRHAQDEDEPSAWWKSHRPSFGAVSYGIDADSLQEDSIKVCDLSPEQWDQIGGQGHIDGHKARHRRTLWIK